MMQYDVKSAHTTGNGQLVTGRGRVKGMLLLGATTAGDVVLYDTASNSATGNELLRFAVPNNSNNVTSFTLPGEGILFQLGCYASVPTAYNVTLIYG